MARIHERPDWPQLTWNGDALTSLLATVRHKQGRTLGQNGRPWL